MNIFKGTLKRFPYFIRISIATIVLFVAQFLIIYFAVANVPALFKSFGYLPCATVSLSVIVYIISLCIRRLNDAGQSGYWSLMVLIPLVNVILIIYLLFALRKESSQISPQTIPADNTKIPDGTPTAN
jgi:uncharacterized membrane protein YhaH (DUF805 family)